MSSFNRMNEILKKSFAAKLSMGLLLVVISFFTFDILLYQILYQQYDKLNHFSAMDEPTDILITGSSSLQWGIDVPTLAKLTGKNASMLATAGGDVEFRHYVVKEYLEKHKNQPPRIVIFQVDKTIFDRNRYGGEIYLPLEGYYHKGILNEYLNQKWESSSDRFPKKLSRLYSLNQQFTAISAKIYDRFAAPVNRLSEMLQDTTVEQAKVQLRGIENEPTIDRTSKWRERYSVLEAQASIDPDMQREFLESAELLRESGVVTLLLEAPNYKLFPTDAYANTREILQSQSYGNIHYLRLEPRILEENDDLYFDAAHLNLEGRALFTKLLSEKIKEFY